MLNRINQILTLPATLQCEVLTKLWQTVLLIVIVNVQTVVSTLGQPLSATPIQVAPEVLSNAFVKCFYKDSKGYVWIGTEDALIRYDGRTAHRYVHDPNDKHSIAHNSVNTFLEDADNRLWIGTAQGLSIYNGDLDNFINVDSIQGTQNYLNNRYITDLEFDRQGKLWIGTHEGGINIYDPVNKKFEYVIDPPDGGVLPASNFINVLLNVGETMWCANKGGLALYDTRTKKRLPLNSLDRFKNAQISAIIPDHAGNLWISTLTGQITKVAWRNGNYSFLEVVSGSQLSETPSQILTMCLDQQENILVGGENSGLNLVDRRTFNVTSLASETERGKRSPLRSVQCVYADDRGLIWIGTFNNGVFLLDNSPKKFSSFISLAEHFQFDGTDARAFAEDKYGNIWIGIYGVGLAKIDAKKRIADDVPKINRQLQNKNVTCLITDTSGDLWLGTAGKGVYRFDPVKQVLTNYSLQSEGFGNDQVFCLHEDHEGTMWAGTWGSGLFYLDRQRKQFVSATEYDKPNHIPNTGYITSILQDSEGTLWVGTLFGLYELKEIKDNTFSYNVHLPIETGGTIKGPQVQSIAQDANRNLWVATSEALNVREHGSEVFTTLERTKGAPINTIRSLLIDNHGNVWIGGNTGLSKLDIRSKSFINYTKNDGLKSNNFQRNAAFASSTGMFFFGSNNGFDAFFPDSICSTSPQTKVVLTDLKINNRSIRPGQPDSPLKKHISVTSDLELAYDQRSFTIDFVAMNFGASSEYTYCYMLEGFDDNWNCSATNSSATYTNIDPGNYVFILKASNRDGVWVDKPVRLEITIQQVFWKTWWAFLIYVSILALFIYFLINVRVERLKLKNEIALEKLTREQEQRLSDLKTQFFTNVAHEFRTPLSLILIPLENLAETKDVPSPLKQRIATAHRNASQMKRLVDELLDFNKLESGNLKLHVQHANVIQFIRETCAYFNEMAEKRKIGFRVTAEVSSVMGWFDKDKLERIMFNLLSNAFKFTADSGEIKVSVRPRQAVMQDGILRDCVELVTEDNGIGIASEELPHIFEKFYQAKSSFKSSSPGTGIGLSLTKALVELHHGTIKVESTPEKSTVFTILLPIDSKVYDIEEKIIGHPDVVVVQKENINAEDLIDDIDPAGQDDERPRILIVEDNEELRHYMVTELEQHFTVDEAPDGEQGLKKASELLPDLIISDIMMPVKDGIELCQVVKSDINTSHIPFILLTAKATMEDQIHGVETGADLYISKPFNVRYLIAHVNQIISSRRKLYARFSQDVYLMPGKATSNALDQEFLQKAIDYVVANLQDTQLGVDSIAELFNLSRMQVYRKIKALTGKSVVEFIRMVRMKEAIKLMDTHKYTLAEIAYEVGFNSASYFTRRFKEEYGKTPSEYLEQN